MQSYFGKPKFRRDDGLRQGWNIKNEKAPIFSIRIFAGVKRWAIGTRKKRRLVGVAVEGPNEGWAVISAHRQCRQPNHAQGKKVPGMPKGYCRLIVIESDAD